MVQKTMNRGVAKTLRMADQNARNDYVPGTPQSRLAMAWTLTREAASLSKPLDVEPRIQRGIVVVIRKKRASGRAKNLADAEALEALKAAGPPDA